MIVLAYKNKLKISKSKLKIYFSYVKKDFIGPDNDVAIFTILTKIKIKYVAVNKKIIAKDSK